MERWDADTEKGNGKNIKGGESVITLKIIKGWMCCNWKKGKEKKEQ